MMLRHEGIIDLNAMNEQTIDAGAILAITHAEAGALARAELARFLKLVDRLEGDDWEQPTDCTEWTVRDIVTHQAGAYAAFASWAQFRRQFSARPEKGQAPVDAMNARQIADRAGRPIAEIVAELREVAPKGIRTRQRLPWLLRKLPVPLGPGIGVKPVEYLTDMLYLRDTWSHRLDLCRATGHSFHQTAEHDGRILALVIRELEQNLADKLGGQSVIFDLSGPAGGRYRVGRTAEPSAIIKMDAMLFNRLASDRLSGQEVLDQELATISGDRAFATRVLNLTSVVY